MRSRAGIKINMLNMGQVARLGEWLTKHRAEFVTSRPLLEDVAKRAEKNLGFHVTPWNVQALRKGMGISWPAARHVMRPKIIQPTLNGLVPMKSDTARAIVVAADDRKLLFQIAVALRDMATAWGIDSQAARAAGDTGERCLSAMKAAANNTSHCL